MNKITNQHALLQVYYFKKFVRIMRLMIACLLVACLHVSATGHSQEKITLNLKSVELRKALIAIEKKTDYRFLFNEKLVAHRPKVDVNVVETPVIQVLNQLLENTGITYKVLGNKLVVLKATSEEASLADLQDVRVTGKVTGAGGEGLAGVSITVKGTRNGTTTDASGNFAITVPDNAVLVFSYVGYEAKEVAVAGQSTLNVQLTESVRVQEQVVVIGYGTASKRDLTGSITKISGEEVADKPNTNPIASLQSKVPGLYVVNNGTPGKAPDIRIRGTSSIGNLKPLYIVDGIFQDNIDYINPNDIESIEILKDPSSLAIFGVKGATGVIAITTKRAKVGQTIVNYNFTYGFKKLVDKIEMASASEFDTLYGEEAANNGVTNPNYSVLKGANNTDWIDAVTRTGKYHSHNLSVSGTGEKNRFSLGLGFVDDEGIIIHEKQRKYLLSFTDEFKVTKNIKVGLIFNTSRLENPYDATSKLDDARKVMPNVSAEPKTFRVRDPYKSVYDSINIPIYSGLVTAIQNSGVVNPVLEIENTWDKTINREQRYVGSAYIDVNVLKNLNARATWYADLSNVNERIYSPLYYAYNPLTDLPYLYSANQTSVEQKLTDYKKYQQDYVLTYKNRFGDHGLTLTGGFTTYYFGYFYNQAKSVGGGVGNLPIPNDKNKWYVNNGFGTVGQGGATSTQYENTTVSYLARALYNFRNKYYLNASFRDDASSQIPEKNRHQQFWAVGAAWEIGKEEFMKNIPQINFLKLKGSVGVLGNQSTYFGTSSTVPYIAYPGINTGNYSVFGTGAFLAATPKYQKNTDLKWEVINAYEAGLELNGFDNRLHFEFNYYNKTTKDMMAYIDRGSLGLLPILQNGGKIKNWGEELLATWNQSINKDWSVSIGGNITFQKNKILALSEDLAGGVIIDARANNGSAEARTLVGHPIGSFFGYVVEGIYQTNLDLLLSPFAGSLGSYYPGDFKFKDVNGDGVISDKDRTVIGNPSPDFIYGGSVGVKYRSFTLDVDFGGVYGNEIFRVWGALESPFQRTNYPALKIDRWHGPGTSNWEPILSLAHRFNYNGSTYNIEDGSYFRIRNLQLGYTINPKVLSQIKVKNIRVFVNVQNLKTWKNNNGYTAEFGGRATAFGFDEAGGAIPRVTTFGANITF
jgi:TonB-linked SusC/RagA family outer membrane protein